MNGRRYWPAVMLCTAVLIASIRLLARTDYAVGDDLLEYAGPFSTFFWRSLAEGDSPLWNPYQETGISLFNYSPWMGPFYPLSLLFALLPFPWAVNVGYLIHIIIAGAGCYFFARRLGLERAGATTAATVLILSSEFVYRINQGYLPDAVSVAWLPWLLFCVEGIVRARRPIGAAALMGICIGLLLLGGHTTHNWMVLFSTVLYAAARALTLPPGEAGGRLRVIGLAVAAALVAGALMAAVQVLPTAQAIAWSPTSGGRELRPWAEFIHEWWRVLQLPFLGAGPNLRGVGFVGVAAAALAVIGVGDWITQRVRAALFVTAGLSYVFFISPSVGLYGILVKVIPTFGILSYTYLFLFPVVLVLAVCAGRGLDLLAERPPAARELAVLAGAATACLAWAWWYWSGYRYPDTGLPVPGGWLFAPFLCAASATAVVFASRRGGVLNGGRFAAVAMAVLLLEMTGYTLYATEPAAAPFDARAYFSQTPLLDIMKRSAASGGRFRFWDLELRRDEGRRLIKHHQSTIDHLEDVGITSKLPRARYSYYSRLLGERLTLDRYGQVALGAIRGVPHEMDLDHEGRGAGRLIAMLNVRYILSDVPLKSAEYRPVAEHDGVKLYEHPDVPPRAYVASKATPVSSGVDAVREMLDPAFIPGKHAVLEASGPFTGTREGRATITEYRNTVVEIRVFSPGGGVLVLNDPFDANWRAEIDGRRVPTMRANYLFRAVRIPPGESRVIFRYTPVLFYIGSLVGPITAAGLLVIAVTRRRRGGGGSHDPDR